MHECSLCGRYCDCDGECHDQPAPDDCRHECEDDEDDDDFGAFGVSMVDDYGQEPPTPTESGER